MPGSSPENLQRALNRPIRLFLVTNHLDRGGVEEIVLTLVRLLDGGRFRISVACFTAGHVFDQIAQIPGVRATHINTRSRLRRFLRMWKIARACAPDIVHEHSGWWGLIVGTLVGAKRVESVHNRFQWFNWHERLRYGIYCRLAHKMIAVAESVKSFTLESFPLMQPTKFLVIHNGVNLERFQNAGVPTGLRSALGIRSDDVVLGFVGRLVEQKGIRYLLEIVSLIASDYPNVKLVLVGDGELRKDLEDQAARLNLRNVVFAGFQPDAALYYRLFDIFVLSSLFEGLPVSVLEAMGAGLPVVATAVSGTVEAVEDGVTGFLVEPGNITQLRERIVDLIDNPALRKKMGLAARERVRREFSDINMVRQTERLYLDLMARA